MTGRDLPTGNGTDRALWDDTSRPRSEVFGVLFERHARAIYNYCFRQTGSWAAAEDLVSTVSSRRGDGAVA